MKTLYQAAILAAAGIVGIGAAELQTSFAATAEPRLIGYGCGDSPPIYAAEEDQFPSRCAEIITIEEACAVYREPVTEDECEEYWREGV